MDYNQFVKQELSGVLDVLRQALFIPSPWYYIVGIVLDIIFMVLPFV